MRQEELDQPIRCLIQLATDPANPRRIPIVVLTLAAAMVCVWITVASWSGRPLERKISVIALSRSGKLFASGTSSSRITIWTPRTEAAARQVEFARGSLNDLAFSPDERFLAIAGADLEIADLQNPDVRRLVRSDARNYGTVRFSRDGKNLLVVTGTGLIERIDADSGATRVTICCSTIYGDVAFTSDEQAIVNAGHRPGIWDVNSGRRIGVLTPTRESFTFRPIGFDPVQGSILMGSQDGRVYVWDLATRERLAVSAPQSGYVDTLAVSTTGWVAYAGFGAMLRLWNPRTGEQRSFPHARPTSNVLFDEDAGVILFGTADGHIESWNTMGQLVRTIRNSS
jgi:WD40 repeat protein